MEEKESAPDFVWLVELDSNGLSSPIQIDYDRAYEYESYWLSQCEIGSGSFWLQVQICFPLPRGPLRTDPCYPLARQGPVGPGYIGYLQGVGLVTIWFRVVCRYPNTTSADTGDELLQGSILWQFTRPVANDSYWTP